MDTRDTYLGKPEGYPEQGVQPESVHIGYGIPSLIQDGLDVYFICKLWISVSDSRVDQPEMSTFPPHEIPNIPLFFYAFYRRLRTPQSGLPLSHKAGHCSC